jgi:Acyl-CoA dehydrogenase, C-terminal domain
MEAAERALFESGVRHATEASSGAALDSALNDLGWTDALDAHPATAVSVLFECLGGSHATSGALDWLLAAELGTGSRRPGVVLPALRACDPPGDLSDDRCVVQGLGTEAFGRSDEALVVAETTEGVAALAVATEALQRRPVHGLDPALGLVEVTGTFDVGPRTVQEPVDWDGAVALGQLALGSELVGAARAMLELARVHALERMQFGRPIATFQAVRHRLADALVSLEAAGALLEAAWEEPSAVNARMAKAFAGRSARSATRHCQQVLAGIGFSTEHPLHLFVRRTVVLDQLLGAGSALTHELGTDILESCTLPPAFPL